MNQSKLKDFRCWRKWQESGACFMGNTIADILFLKQRKVVTIDLSNEKKEDKFEAEVISTRRILTSAGLKYRRLDSNEMGEIASYCVVSIPWYMEK